MFVDKVQISLSAGKGGDGIVAWRRERFLPKGGPYGGNGGKGGSLIIEADPGIHSLDHYRPRQKLKAKNGQQGGVNLRQGASGKNLTLKVPYGTLVKDKETGEILFDFTTESKKWVACLGGGGGRGNASFKTSTNRAPNKCTLGRAGEEKEVELELKLIADVGLVGMPNAGKSTLMSKVTKAKVKVGAYPFTTLAPNLSFIQCEDYRRILVADIPGVIKNAHQDKGLGLAFLRHIERTNTLVFVIDASGSDGRDPLEDFLTLRNEIKEYSLEMLDKPFLTVLNKCDRPEAAENIEAFKQAYAFDLSSLYEISALEESGLVDFVDGLSRTSLPEIARREYAPAE